MSTLLIAEHDRTGLSSTTARTLTAALQLGSPVDILVAGHDCGAAAEKAATLSGIRKVIYVDNPQYGHCLPEPLAALIASLASQYTNFVAPGTATGKSVLPRVAAQLDVMQVSEVTKVISHDTFERSIYAGNALQTVQATDPKKVLTVRTAAFAATEEGPVQEIEKALPGTDPKLSSFKDEALVTSDRPELGSARIIISGGRSLASAENFKKFIEPIAERLGAAIGASRAAVDAGYAPNTLQVGQTGKIVAPDLYIAVGISGAIQHLAGMKDSKVIVAINSDPDAPIFTVADYGLVSDLFVALPEIEKELSALAD